MSLEHAILGFLNYKAFSGYDLKKVFDTSVQHFWSADQSQIYRTLTRLEDRGWATVEVVEQDERPDRKVYHLTPQGREELLRWLATPVGPKSPRVAFLIQVFFAAQLPDEEILGMLRGWKAALEAVLAQYAAIPPAIEEYREMIGSQREAFFWMLTLECGIAGARAQLAWVESAIERIEHKRYISELA